MEFQKIETADTIWKFHINPSDSKLFLECKTSSNEFYLWDPIENIKWEFPKLNQYVYSILQVQYPYTFISYYHQDNLLKPSMLMCYNLFDEKEVWSKSDVVLLSCFKGVLKVYNSKIEPKQIEYIDLLGNKTKDENLIEVELDVEHASKESGIHSIKQHNLVYKFEQLEDEKCLFSVEKSDNRIYEIALIIEDYNFEYDYLLRIGSRIVLLLDKHSLLLLQ